MTLVLMTLVLMTLISCSGSNSGGASPARANVPQSIPVTVATAQQQDLPIYLNGLGSVTAYYTVGVKSRVDGQLIDVKFKEGESVSKGALLAVIDPRPYRVQLDQAQATLFRDQASLRDAQLNYQRYKSLLTESGAVSQQQVDTQKSTVDQLEGTVRNDEALVTSARLNLTYCHITAPESGRIGLRQVDPGNIVHAADANPLLVITQLQPITVLFNLPEDQLQTVSQHMRNGQLPVDAYSRDDQTKLASGKLLTIDNQIDSTTGTGKLKAIFDNKNSELWPNQFVNVHLLLDTQKNVTVIPAAAVQRGPQGYYVFVVKPDRTVEVRMVSVSTTQGDLAEIASGVSPNETIVTDGQDKLQADSHVEPHQTPAGQGAPNPAGQSSSDPSGGQGRRNRGGGPRTSGNANSGTSTHP
jgi:multidrug efflux system membrane fusion protein